MSETSSIQTKQNRKQYSTVKLITTLMGHDDGKLDYKFPQKNKTILILPVCFSTAAVFSPAVMS